MARATNGTNQSLQSVSALSALSGVARIAVSFWVNTDFASDDDIILELSTNSNSNAGSFKVIANDSSSGLFWIDVDGNTGKASAACTAPSANAWHHVLCNVNFGNAGSSEVETIYIDGVNQSSLTRNFNSNNTGTFGSYVLYVMSRNNASNFGDGAISDLCIWAPSTAVSSTDAGTLAGGIRANTIRTSEIAYYWPLAGTSSSTEYAAIGGINLTVNGATNTTEASVLTSDPGIVQLATADSGSSNAVASVTATFGSTPAQNNLLVAVAASDNTLTMSSSGWTQAVNITNFSAMYIWYKLAGASESTTVQVSTSPSDTISLGVMEYKVDAGWVASPSDKTATNSTVAGNTTTLATGTTAITTVANELAIAAVDPHGFSASVPTNPSWSNSFIVTLNGTPTTGSTNNIKVALFISSKILTATGTQTTTATWTTGSNDAVAAIATFKIAGGNFFASSWLKF